MLISLRWLNEIFPSGLAPEEITDVLTRAGLEVEKTVDLGMASGKLVVARVLEFAKHPNADRLSVVKADVGAERPAEIVCGADNLYEGMLVACAIPGAVLPDGMKIRKTKLRGEPSEGMLCSARELNFGADHSGIMDLPDTFKVGEPFDYIIDIKVTPNRADCLSLIGVARDVAAMTGRKFEPPVYLPDESGSSIDGLTSVEVEAPTACPRYALRLIENAKMGPSPLGFARRLEASGERAISNIVDVTNYVMLEYGQPLHAFDFDSLKGGRIVVRLAQEGETLLTLDGTEIKLHPEDLVIADAERPIALAGVMGGKNTEVTDKTTRIALECANFDPVSIRRAARRHSIQTESSYRFERGVDRENLEAPLNRAAQLIQELAGGEVARGFIDVHNPPAKEVATIPLEFERLNRFLGLELGGAEIEKALVDLGFTVEGSNAEGLVVRKPTYRMDVATYEDLAEEVARIYGYEKIPDTLPAIASSATPTNGKLVAWLRGVRSFLTGLGFSEAIHYGIISETLAARHGFDAAKQPHLANPLTSDHTIMRPSLMPELLRTCAFNQRQGAESIALFEIGNVFAPEAAPGREEDQKLSLGLILAGNRPGNWAGTPRPFDFFDLKGALESLGTSLGLDAITVGSLGAGSTFHPGRSGSVLSGENTLGVFGELHPDLAEAIDLRGRVYAAELDLSVIFELLRSKTPRFHPIPKFPSSERDLALVVDAGVPAEKLIDTAREAGRPILEDLAVVDLYTGEHVAEGKKSLALRFRLRSAEATLSEDEINAVMAKVLKALEEQCGTALRS